MLERTGIDLPGEANSIFLKEEKMGPVELATVSFGQRFEVTPMQMIGLVGSIANKGVRVTPRLVKGEMNKEGEIEEYAAKEKGRAISEKTALNVLSMMESVVAERNTEEILV